MVDNGAAGAVVDVCAGGSTGVVGAGATVGLGGVVPAVVVVGVLDVVADGGGVLDDGRWRLGRGPPRLRVSSTVDGPADAVVPDGLAAAEPRPLRTASRASAGASRTKASEEVGATTPVRRALTGVGREVAWTGWTPACSSGCSPCRRTSASTPPRPVAASGSATTAPKHPRPLRGNSR